MLKAPLINLRTHHSISRPQLACRAHTTPTAAAFHVGPFEFPTKRAAREQARALLFNTKLGQMILKNSEDGMFLSHLVQQHPRALHKLGVGVSYFTAATTVRQGVSTKHFVLHRIDGTHTDISYIKCLDAIRGKRDSSPGGDSSDSSDSSDEQPSWSDLSSSSTRTANTTSSSSSRVRANHTSSSSMQATSPRQDEKQQLLISRHQAGSSPYPAKAYFQALRAATASQLDSFKAAALLSNPSSRPCCCPDTGVQLNAGNAVAIETAATPFPQLVNNWLKQEGLQLQLLQLGKAPGSRFPRLADPKQQQSWQEYYRSRVQLQLISKQSYDRSHRGSSRRKNTGGTGNGTASSSSSRNSSRSSRSGGSSSSSSRPAASDGTDDGRKSSSSSSSSSLSGHKHHYSTQQVAAGDNGSSSSSSSSSSSYADSSTSSIPLDSNDLAAAAAAAVAAEAAAAAAVPDTVTSTNSSSSSIDIGGGSSAQDAGQQESSNVVQQLSISKSGATTSSSSSITTGSSETGTGSSGSRRRRRRVTGTK